MLYFVQQLILHQGIHDKSENQKLKLEQSL